MSKLNIQIMTYRQGDTDPFYMAELLKSNLQCTFIIIEACLAELVQQLKLVSVHCSLFGIFNGRLKGCFVQHGDRMCLVSVYLIGAAAPSGVAAAPSEVALFDME